MALIFTSQMSFLDATNSVKALKENGTDLNQRKSPTLICGALEEHLLTDLSSSTARILSEGTFLPLC